MGAPIQSVESGNGTGSDYPEKFKGINASHDIINSAGDFELQAITSTPLAKIPSNQASLAIPTRTQRQRSQSPDTLSLISVDDFHELRLARSLSNPVEQNGLPPKTSTQGPQTKLQAFWTRNKGLAFVLIAQIFGTLMNITTRLLELDGSDGGKGMHPFQILFARMSITSLLSLLYMWYKKLPDAPFGAHGIRLLLIARGVGGFFGVFGLYWSLQYLPLSDATVLSFLAPSIACWVCSKIIHEPFTRVEQLGGLVSLIGVVLIARPTYLFSSPPSPVPTSHTAATSPSPNSSPVDSVTPSQHLAAVGMAMVGVLGAAVAYTTIRWIGTRAHPLISVNYFAVWCTLVSTIALAFVPGIPFILPSTPRQWALLFFIGVSGFAMQFLLTAGLRYEKSSRATNMVYSQMLFAIVGDRVVFGSSPGLWSLAGSALILGSAVVVAVQKEGGGRRREEGGVEGGDQGEGVVRDEEMGLVRGLDGSGEPVDEDGALRMQQVSKGERLSREGMDKGSGRPVVGEAS